MEKKINMQAQELNEEALEQVSGGMNVPDMERLRQLEELIRKPDAPDVNDYNDPLTSLYMDVFCTACRSHCKADVSKDRLYCSYCGKPIRLI